MGVITPLALTPTVSRVPLPYCYKVSIYEWLALSKSCGFGGSTPTKCYLSAPCRVPSIEVLA